MFLCSPLPTWGNRSNLTHETTYFPSQATRDRAAAPRGTVAPPSGAPGAPQGPRATVVGGTRASQLGALRMNGELKMVQDEGNR